MYGTMNAAKLIERTEMYETINAAGQLLLLPAKQTDNLLKPIEALNTRSLMTRQNYTYLSSLSSK